LLHERSGINVLRSFPKKFLGGAGIRHPRAESDPALGRPASERNLSLRVFQEQESLHGHFTFSGAIQGVEGGSCDPSPRPPQRNRLLLGFLFSSPPPPVFCSEAGRAAPGAPLGLAQSSASHARPSAKVLALAMG